MKFDALVPEMNCQLQRGGSKQHACLEGTAGRRHVRGARAHPATCHITAVY